MHDKLSINLLFKGTHMKKTNLKKSAKPVKKSPSKKAAINHLQPIDDILDFIELNEIKLKNLLDAIPAKLEKLVTAAKAKVTKSIEQLKKSNIAHKAALLKHKAKPNQLTQAAVKKVENVVSDIAKSVESAKGEHAVLQTQLMACKDMKKHFSAAHKSSVKKSSAKKSAPTKKPAAKKQNTVSSKKLAVVQKEIAA